MRNIFHCEQLVTLGRRQYREFGYRSTGMSRKCPEPHTEVIKQPSHRVGREAPCIILQAKPQLFAANLISIPCTWSCDAVIEHPLLHRRHRVSVGRG